VQIRTAVVTSNIIRGITKCWKGIQKGILIEAVGARLRGLVWEICRAYDIEMPQA